ncbi:hypothetical protein OIU84_024577 [Salix udensis]|uniref:Uncharacterized protein n=1 Tax=Salix udensis TaxID=889485 RepID=A0AAD6PBE8_9ROSI|nr:hypothetical protein OIU84_024577 [Salix udensis]
MSNSSYRHATPQIPSNSGSSAGVLQILSALTLFQLRQTAFLTVGVCLWLLSFVTNWDCQNCEPIFSRVKKLKGQFANLYVVVSLPIKEQNDSFVHSYFKYGMELGKPTFVPVQDLEMGFEKIVKIAHSRGTCKRQDALSKLKAERKQSVQGMDNFLRVVTSIPGIDNHDANALNQAIGSIEAIAKASKEYILENTDLSADNAETVTRFFRDPKFYLGPKLN